MADDLLEILDQLLVDFALAFGARSVLFGCCLGGLAFGLGLNTCLVVIGAALRTT